MEELSNRDNVKHSGPEGKRGLPARGDPAVEGSLHQDDLAFGALGNNGARQ